MKKNYVFALMSAIALTSAVSFTACSSDDAVVENNPTYDGSNVKTQFSISFPENVASTRMAASTVQASEDIAGFRGMTDIVLIPYSHATNRANRLGSNITLAAGKMIKPQADNAANSIPSGQLLANNNAVLFQDVTIPLGTSGFLFYGKAGNATDADGYANGSLTTSAFTGESSSISFAPTPIVTTITKTKGEALATYVTSIANAKDATDATITWAACADANNAAQTWYSEGLGQLYTNFTRLKAGASAYVQAAVQDLYSSIKDNTDKVSVAIKNAILNNTYADDDDENGILTFTAAISGYPGADNNSMPDGTAVLSWSSGTATAATSGATFENFNVQDMANIVYPASLYYYANSGVKVSNGPKKDEYDKPANNTWEKILDTYGDGTSVTATTRSVAIKDQIQYAVGRLDVSVAALNASKYYDMEGKEMTIPTGAFTLNGVLIGGQKSVDYKFEPSASATTEYVIYDKTINTENSTSAVLSTTQAIGPTYTLALETAAEQPVYVVLEFVNNSGKDFRGFDGIVKAGCKFYMVAQLDPTQDVTGKVSGSANTAKKVFKQDFKTIANFTIGVGSADGDGDGDSDNPGGFANAYTTIPDLRTPQLELGFSVDLKWQAGITFNVTF